LKRPCRRATLLLSRSASPPFRTMWRWPAHVYTCALPQFDPIARAGCREAARGHWGARERRAADPARAPPRIAAAAATGRQDAPIRAAAGLPGPRADGDLRDVVPVRSLPSSASARCARLRSLALSRCSSANAPSQSAPSSSLTAALQPADPASPFAGTRGSSRSTPVASTEWPTSSAACPTARAAAATTSRSCARTMSGQRCPRTPSARSRRATT